MEKFRNMESVPFFYHPDFTSYDFGANHPFRGERFGNFLKDLKARFPEVYEILEIKKCEMASEDQILLAHTKEYVQTVKTLENRRGFLTLDTQIFPGSVDAARLISGASIDAAKAARDGGLALGFGGLHHAGPDYGGGFCIYNDIAVAAKTLLNEGIRRVVILDTDAHQGNGTMDIFYSDPRVLFFSLHQDPRTLFPGRGFTYETGNSEGEGYTVNIPMPPFAGWPEYEMAMNDIVIPLIDEFKPEIIIRNGGSDPLYTDVLTNLGLTLESLSKLQRLVAQTAEEREIPLADLFLSGYGPYVTEGWFALVRGTLDKPMDLNSPEQEIQLSPEKKEAIHSAQRNTLDELAGYLKPHWKCFQ